MNVKLKKILIITAWYPDIYNQISGTFVRDQINYLNQYIPRLQQGTPCKIVILKPLVPLDIPNYLFRGKKMYRKVIEENNMPVIFEQSFTITNRCKWGELRRERKIIDRGFEKACKILEGFPEIIIAVTLSGLIWSMELLKRKNLKIPVILQEHSGLIQMHMRTPQRTMRGLSALKDVNAIIVVADRQINELKELSNGKPVYRIWNPVGEVFLKNDLLKKNIGHSTLKIINTGSLSEVKAQHRLLNAVSMLPEELVQSVDILGDGNLKEELIRQSQTLGILNKVKFWGNVNAEKVAELLAQSDLFVLCSRRENCPVALIEAQTMGIPSIVTKNNGSELVLLPGNGIVVEQDDGKKLAEGILRFSQKRNQFDRSKIRKLALEHFTPEIFVKKFYEVIQSVM